MRGQLSWVRRRDADAVVDAGDPRQLVVVLGLLLILVQIAFRAWASFHGWFYADDFEFLTEATGRSLDLGYLMRPHDSQLMPGGLLAAWAVAHTGAFDWASAAAVLVVLQLVASVACLVMLVRLFGHRWLCLALLAFYLFSPLTITGYLWWAAAINQLPFQAAFFGCVTLHVAYLRTGRLRPGLLGVLVFVLGLCFYVKTLLIVGPLVLITFLYFSERNAPLPRRLLGLLGRHWRVGGTYAAVVGGYVAYYVVRVPNPLVGGGPIDYGGLADTMLRVSLGSALVGGPWRWSLANPPLGQVATPAWAVTLAWVLIAVSLVLVLRSGRGDWRAFLVVVPHLLASYLLTARGRGAALGSFAGLELRYLADAAPVITLGLALLLLRLRTTPVTGPPGAATPAPERRPHPAVLVCATAIVLGAVASNVQYARFWTAPFPAKAFSQTVIDQSRREPLRLVDVPVPELVMTVTSFPSNLPSRMFAPLGDRVSAFSAGTDLDMLGSGGTPYPAVVTGGATSLPGPNADCGYPVRETAVPVTLDGGPDDFFWWLQVSYLANADGTLEVSLGGQTRRLPVEAGIHRLYLQGEGSVQDLSLRTTSVETGLCVDRVDIGDVSALEPLS